ncbi:MAG TPA: site-2 protease family protein [Baekduia sp.]|nr:site-2 protease family protein [Baekduia sp.]
MRHHGGVFGGSGSIQLGRILGIRIGASPSWFVVLFVLIYLLSDYFDGYLTAVAAAFCFFASLLAHELGHAIAARREGIGTSGIDLWFFGGIAKLTREPRTPGEEFRVAVAGPLVTLLLVGVCLGLAAALARAGEVWDAALLRDSGGGAAVELLGWLALVNGFLLAFNLVPAFPLDGGRIARAAVWRATGDRLRATRVSARLGQSFGYVLIGLGIFLLATGDPANGIYMAVLGWFLAQAAGGAVLSTAFAERLDGITAADLMDADPVTVPGDAAAARAQDEFFLRYRWPWFFAVDAAGRYLGLLRSERVDDAVHDGRDGVPVRDLLDADGGLQVRGDTPLQALLGH